MRSGRLLPLVVALFSVAACDKKKQAAPPPPPEIVAKPSSVDVSKLAIPALFANVPADTPYMIAAFDAISLEYYAKLKRALGPSFGRIYDMIRQADDDGTTSVVDAIAAELAGKWDAKGLTTLGFEPSPRFALYGLGIAPVVFRIEVRDDKTVLATIERIAQRAGSSLPPLENHGGRSFLRLGKASNDQVAIVALADNQLVIAFGRTADIDGKLALILGGEKPPVSMADGKILTAIMTKHGFGPHMVGFVDTRKLVTQGLILAGMPPTQTCTAAIDQLGARVPRLVLGYSLLSAGVSSGGAVLELAPDLVTQLEGMRTEVPGLLDAMAGKPLLALGIGANIDRARELVTAAMGSVRKLGEACALPDLVSSSASLSDAMEASLSRPIRSMTGVVLAVHDVVLATSSPVPEKLEGFFALTATDPKALYAQLNHIPDIQQLGIPSDGKVHPVKGLPVPIPMHAGVGDRAIAVGVGTTGKALAERALAARATGKAPFVLMSYDYGKFLELQSKISLLVGDPDPLADAERELNEGLAKLFGRTTASVDVNKHGVAFWGTIEMK